jgi:hypothetical protein
MLHRMLGSILFFSPPFLISILLSFGSVAQTALMESRDRKGLHTVFYFTR